MRGTIFAYPGDKFDHWEITERCGRGYYWCRCSACGKEKKLVARDIKVRVPCVCMAKHVAAENAQRREAQRFTPREKFE